MSIATPASFRAETIRLCDAVPLYRPTQDADSIQRMYEGSNVVWTAGTWLIQGTLA
ncbi:MAG TPA: hypothetical protein VKE93_08645 [Candidatus Angelobacter sp.]|nr:hypothetical protein [Candidatus Angelobacter sp.]